MSLIFKQKRFCLNFLNKYEGYGLGNKALQSQGTNNNHNYSRWKTNLRVLCRLITIIVMNMGTILQNESFLELCNPF